MRTEDKIAAAFEKNGWTWSLKGRGQVIPNVYDIEAALDKAAEILYAEPVDAQLEVGRLIIKKTNHGHDVYLYVGEYE